MQNLLKKLLFIGILLSFGYVAYTFSNKDYSFKKEIISQQGLPEKGGGFSRKGSEDYSSFLKEIEKREVFVSSYSEREASPSGPDRANLSKTIESLALTGIIPGEPPKIVIEDKKTGRSFYLKEEESFLDSILVESIEKNSCVLNYYGETFELYL